MRLNSDLSGKVNNVTKLNGNCVQGGVFGNQRNANLQSTADGIHGYRLNLNENGDIGLYSTADGGITWTFIRNL